LTGIDDVGPGDGGPDLVDVPAFDGIAEDDFHASVFAGGRADRQGRSCRSVRAMALTNASLPVPLAAPLR
jgi:hypothetical protein